ncbi:YihY/virulence factor BrkB family protein [Catalinimonas niigatensis]|uniref:YihY/virulence factor BrkB family protein n=1 Tax=Catalinimonas niigatensis TaxID=1397264 RepID=UPI00266557FF|nr:YihY/virulence factor BrkB family protein [Catalinimonas niigatensis]WPP51049.1 YihY/virulence factor BrkB family protein [Catalinimonas niigatensis]
MSKFFKQVYALIRETISTFQKHDPVVYAAAIAFFTVFSLPSVLIIIVKVIGSVFSTEQIQSNLAQQIESLVGTASSEEIISIIEKRSTEESSLLFSIISIIFLVFSATVIFAFIQKALNAIWNVKPKPKKGALKFAKDRILSFSIIIVLGFLMLVSLSLEAILSMAGNFLQDLLSGYTVYFMQIGNYFLSLIVISSIFALIFKFLPDAKIRWKDVGVGAVVTGLLFTLGKYLIGLMLSNTNVASTYGAAGSLAGILVWVFYSSIIVLIGAMFTRVYADTIGRKITPKKHSVRVETREVEM